MSQQRNLVPVSFCERWAIVRKNPRILVGWPLFAIVIALIGWAALFANLRSDRKAVEERALFEASALARTHADRLMRSIDAIDQIALHVRADWRLSSGKFLLEHMRKEGAFPPSQYYVTLVDRNGVTFSSTLTKFKPTFLGDRPYFRTQKESSTDYLHIEAPLLSRLSGINVIDFSRKLIDADGVFQGIVLVSVDVGFFTANYDATILGKHGLLGVINEDRTLGVLRIGPKVLPTKAAAFIPKSVFPSNSGSALLNGKASFEDGRTRYIAWHPVRNYPLTAVVGLDEADTLSQFLAGRRSAIIFAWWGTVALAVITIITIILNAELVWRNHRINLANATYRLATEEGGEGFYIVEPILNSHGDPIDFTVVDCNQQGASFFNLRQKQLKGRTISSFDVELDVAIFMRLLTKAFDEGKYESELDVPIQHPLALRAAHLKIIRSGGNLAVRLRDISETKAHMAELKRRGNEDTLPVFLTVSGYRSTFLRRWKRPKKPTKV